MFFLLEKNNSLGHTIAHTQPDDALLPDIIDYSVFPGHGNPHTFPTNVPNIGHVNINAETRTIIGSSHILPLSSAALSSRTSVTALEVYHRLNQVASQLRSLRPASDWTMPVNRPPPIPSPYPPIPGVPTEQNSNDGYL